MMHEIFIPTHFHTGKIINVITSECMTVFQMFENIMIHNFESDLLHGISFQFQQEIPEDIIRMCNGEFGKYYFIERDIGNKKVFSSGSTILGNTKLFDTIPDITVNIESILSELASSKLMTRTKMGEIEQKITETLFVLSGLVYSLEGIVRITTRNTEEMRNYSGEIQYESQAELLAHISEQKMQEVMEMKKKLYPQLVLFLETIHKII